MQTQLLPIFQLRELCLAAINPVFYQQNATMIRNSSLAAQDYLLSGTYKREYHSHLGRNFKHLPGYRKIHEKYSIPYNPYATSHDDESINPGLVMDLAWSFNTDIVNGIIDANGNIRNRATLPNSQVLGAYHCSAMSGTPSSAFRLLLPSQMDAIFAQLVKTK